ncbi:MAG: hypothetical protein KDC27_10415, partial [Acidobacteria bacterium]|nr:hypothetical protein [Acidobacteriota bacterium]
MAENVVEAVLSSRFEDRVTAALERTTAAVRRGAESMNRGLTSANAALGGLVAGAVIQGLGFLVSVFQRARDAALEFAGKAIQLSGAVIKQTEDMRSLAGIYEFAREKLTGYTVKLALAVQQSGVFQEALKRVEEQILKLDPSKDQL